MNKEIDLTQILQCPVCLMMPYTGDVFQCQNGHIVCDMCRPLVTNNKCPTCRVRVHKYSRCLVVEQILAQIDRKCENQPRGCDFSGTKDEVKAHLSSCPQRLIYCPVATCNAKLGISSLKQHVRESHMQARNEVNWTQRGIVKDEFSIKGNEWESSFCFIPIDLFEYDGQMFFSQIWRSDEVRRQGEWYFWIYYVGSHEESKKYSYTVTVGNSTTKVKYEAQTVSIDHNDFGGLIEFGNPLRLDDAQIVKLSKDHNVKFKWEVFRN